MAHERLSRGGTAGTALAHSGAAFGEPKRPNLSPCFCLVPPVSFLPPTADHLPPAAYPPPTAPYPTVFLPWQRTGGGEYNNRITISLPPTRLHDQLLASRIPRRSARAAVCAR